MSVVLVSQKMSRGNGDQRKNDLHVIRQHKYISLLDGRGREAYRVLWEELTPRGNVVNTGTER